MKFVKALEVMKNGEIVKRPSWSGYWYWDAEKETVMIQCRPQDCDDGELLDIRDTKRVEYTLSHITYDDWVIEDGSNCTDLGGKVTFSFGEAINYLKVERNWN